MLINSSSLKNFGERQINSTPAEVGVALVRTLVKKLEPISVVYLCEKQWNKFHFFDQGRLRGGLDYRGGNIISLHPS